MKRLLTLFLSAACALSMYAQSQTVKGTVKDAVGEPVIGATIKVPGTTLTAVTDFDGHFTLNNVPSGAKVDVSYIGMKSKTVLVSNNMAIFLEDDAKMLDEIVVIGYGSAKAKDLTSPIAVVRAEDIANVPATSPMTAMQGKVAGVNVVSSGTPGTGPTVHIRGNGSFSNSTPLYVVDGMFYDNVNFLNASDIKDMSVLKDASSAAIYGVRAANGVVIITTKKGNKNQKAQISYDGYFGVQNATNVLKMANSSQYGQMLMEADYDSYSPYLKASIDRYGGSYADSDFHNWTYGSDTDWYNELLRSATITNHAVNISGGSERASYSVGANYLYQNGIMDVDNNYKRFNLRGALDYEATNWLKVGFNMVYSKSEQVNPNSNAWQLAFNSPGIYPIYDDNNTNASPTKYASPTSIGLTNNFYNPIATANYYNSKNKTNQLLANFYADLTLIPEKLHLKTSISYDHSTIEGYTYIPKYYVGESQKTDASTLTKENTTYNNHIWDNTLTYNESVGRHNFGAMAGFSMRQESYRKLTGKAYNVPDGKDEYYYISQGDEETRTSSDEGTTYRGMSYFARLNYNYASKYYLMFTFRADGSSKYQEHWGYFPSVGASWVVTEEPFMKKQRVLDYLKIRASWGKLGNDHVAASDGFASITTGNSASGVFGNNTFAGFQNTTYFSWLKWEIVDEINLGLNLATFKNRFNLDFDYFHRMTKDAVISASIPFENTTLAGNYGKILNQGFDVSATWNDRIGKDFKYHIGANLSFLWNEVKDLNGSNMIQSAGKVYNIVGEEMNSFYGYKVIGIYQNAEQIANDPIAVSNGCEPGDFIYEDKNHNNELDGDDRQVLGSYLPNFTYGINLGFEYKNFDFELSTYGQSGAQIFNRKRALRYAQSNYNFDLDQYKNRWTGEGSTNTQPSAKALIKGWNVSDQRLNSYFIESADFFRIQNVTLGYSFKKLKLGSYTLPSLRFSVTADRPLTLFSANTFTPEISDSYGWDTNVYPLTATYTFGVQIQF
jgi:TonB-linked SusC/RagA family outer membrane protein